MLVISFVLSVCGTSPVTSSSSVFSSALVTVVDLPDYVVDPC